MMNFTDLLGGDTVIGCIIVEGTMRRHLIALAVCGGVLAFAAPPVSAADVALPTDVAIVAPAVDVPENVRRFHGTWSGKWDGKLDHKLIVEKVDVSGSATVVYAWGDYPQWRVARDWMRTTAAISGDEMTLKRGNDKVRYVFRPDGALGATYDSPGHTNYGTFSRE